MDVPYDCPGCDRELSVPLSAAGKRVRCKSCEQVAHVPRPLTIEQGDPRPHHYTFAHRFLPQMALGSYDQSALFLHLTADPTGASLQESWRLTAKVTGLDPALHLQPDGLRRMVFDAGERHALVAIQLPPARRLAEALFVGALVDKAPDAATFPVQRFFTLEPTLNLIDGRPSTMLCEWSLHPQEGRLVHVNWGFEGPWADSPEMFAVAVRDLLGDPDRRPMV